MKALWIPISLFLLTLSSACGDDDEPATETAEPTAEEAQPEAEAEPPRPATKALMAEHFRKAWSARDAIIRGDFDEAKTDVGWLATHNQGDRIPSELRPKLAPMQAAAQEFVDTDSLTEAGAAFARMLHRCGECHAEAEGGPHFEPGPPPEGEGLDVEMQRHRWAADRMWEGMVAPDPEAFAHAAQVLSDTQMGLENIEQEGGGDVDPERLRALVTYVHEMAEEAKDADSEDARILAYGRFIASCAGCHRLVGKGPGHDSEPSLTNELVAPSGGGQAAGGEQGGTEAAGGEQAAQQ